MNDSGQRLAIAYGLAVVLAAGFGVVVGFVAGRGVGPDDLHSVQERVAHMSSVIGRMDDRLTRVSIKVGAEDD